MIPVLIHFGFIKIYTMGVFLVLAFLAAAFALWRNIKLTSHKEEEIFDGLFVTILGAFLGARVVHVLLNFEKFGFDIMKFILVNGYPGLSLFGALLGGFITLFLFMRSRKVSVVELSEYVVPPLFLALTIAKVGSFLSGSDIGTVTSFPLSVVYAGVEGTRHIVALYEAVFFLIGYVISYRILFAVRRAQAKPGTSLMLFVAYFGCVELIVDNLKLNHLYLAGLSFNSLAGGLFFVLGALLLLTTYRENIAQIIKNLLVKKQKHVTTTSQQSTTGGAEAGTSE
ncbi:MAG: Prolipoprotein diacylglyceryl transferase [Microgenomates bacterium OLB23]|nr:MAG: Prolipoprotein diacylglyceryl transferase [Microgenomates bacterium OLB23]